MFWTNVILRMQWTNHLGAALQGLTSVVALLATISTTFLSFILARATLRYVKVTDKALQLAHEQFEREWAPELHIRLEKISDIGARVVITNLAKISVLLELWQLRKISHALPSERYLLNQPLVGGTTWSEDISSRLFSVTGREFQGALTVSATFFASGRLYRSDWFRFEVHVSNGRIVEIHPVTMPARRLHVLATKRATNMPHAAIDVVEIGAAGTNSQ
jgi:hypothetical protein